MTLIKLVLVTVVSIGLLQGCKKPDPAKDKLRILASQPERIYCRGEDGGKYREVRNKEVFKYIEHKKRFPPLCRDFFKWEDEQALIDKLAEKPDSETE